MKITDIKPQVKTPGRYSIFVDDKFAFGLYESGLVNSGIRIGQEFDQAGLEELQDTAKKDKAYGRALDLISRRRRSEWELREYLKRKEYTPDVCDFVVDKLRNKAYLDDTVFATAWVENRRLLKSTSRRRLSQELRAKRVPDEIIEQVLRADETDEGQVLRDLIERKRTQSRYQDPQKLMAYLLRQGYNYGDVKEALQG